MLHPGLVCCVDVFLPSSSWKLSEGEARVGSALREQLQMGSDGGGSVGRPGPMNLCLGDPWPDNLHSSGFVPRATGVVGLSGGGAMSGNAICAMLKLHSVSS